MMNIAVVIEQKLHRLVFSRPRSAQQGGVAEAIPRLDRGALRDQRFHHINAASFRRVEEKEVSQPVIHLVLTDHAALAQLIAHHRSAAVLSSELWA